MKKLLCYCVVFLTLISCGDNDSCLEKSGDAVFETIELASFSKIDIPKGVAVELVESSESKIEITSKENYLPNLDFKILNDELVVRNNSNCSMLHDYKLATLRIYTPTLSKIVSRTQFEVSSVGILHFPELFVITSLEEESASSKINLEIDNHTFKIEDNQVGYFKISGRTIWFDVALYGGNGRVEAQDLVTKDCTFYQRSNNDILVQANNKLVGTIYSVGNILVFNKPDTVEVTQKYTGKLIYK